MVSNTELQLAYVELYKQFRKYIWEFKIIKDLANLEIETYRAFPDMNVLSKYFGILYSEIRNILEEDEDLNKSFESFSQLLKDVEKTIYKGIDTLGNIYIKLPIVKVNEVI